VKKKGSVNIKSNSLKENYIGGRIVPIVLFNEEVVELGD